MTIINFTTSSRCHRTLGVNPSLSTSLFLLLPLLFFSSLVTAAPQPQRGGVANDTLPLSPWLVTRLNTGSPSGRPASFPYSGIYVTISDPNTISLGPTRFLEAIFPPSSADCTIRWNTYFEEPYGWTTSCIGNLSHGKWSIEMVKKNQTSSSEEEEEWDPPSPTRNFGIKFTLEEGIILDDGKVVTRIFEGVGWFSVATNLDFICGGSGVCSSGLKVPAGVEGTDKSVPVKQTLVETRVRCYNGSC